MTSFPPEFTRPDGVDLVRDHERILLGFTDPLQEDTIESTLERYDLELDLPGDVDGEINYGQEINNSEFQLWVHSLDNTAISKEQISDLLEDEDIQWVAPVYNTVENSGQTATLPNVLLIEFSSETSNTEIKEFEAEYNLEEVESRSVYSAIPLLSD